jgi:hypothetical protein
MMRWWNIGCCLCGLALLVSGCTLTTEMPTPTPLPDIPTIEFQYPTNNSVVVEGTDLQIQLLAQDMTGVGVARVELFADDVSVSEGTPLVSAAVTTFTITMNWLAEGVGFHALSAVAYRPDGTASDPTTITVEVIASLRAPTFTPAAATTP